jgi:uncharacterized protein (UPF0147 family)
MSYSLAPYVGDGLLVNFPVPFAYIDKAHVQVYVNGVLKALTTDYTWTTTTNIQLKAAPEAGSVVVLKRVTPASSRMVDFQDAAVLTEADLDLSAVQLLYISQEAFDAAANALQLASSNTYDVLNKRITNLATPIDAADAVTKSYVDTTIPANVSSAAASATASLGSANDSAASASSSATSALEAANSAAAAATFNPAVYAPLSSPTLTGTPKAPTPTTADNSTLIATTALVTAKIAAIPVPVIPPNLLQAQFFPTF